MHLNINDRFWSKVEKTDYCWNWLGALDSDGYGVFRDNKKIKKAHRFSFEINKSSIKENLVLDHICRNRRCVNPNHLEAVRITTNIERGLTGIINRNKIKCPLGHFYSGKNSRGFRICSTCSNERRRKS